MAVAQPVSEHVEAIDDLETAYDVFKYLRNLGNENGLEKFQVMSVARESERLTDLSLVNNWDAELLQVYDGEKLVTRSPIVQHLKSSVRPLEFCLSELPQDRSEKERTLTVTLFNDFNMPYGICLPVHDSKGNRGGVTFSAPRADFDKAGTFDLHLICTYAFDKLSSTSMDEETQRNPLSGRERDCLLWTAAGKTSSEIGTILDISDHTVNHYLTSAGKKLDAVNRVQAVAKAIRLGLIGE